MPELKIRLYPKSGIVMTLQVVGSPPYGKSLLEDPIAIGSLNPPRAGPELFDFYLHFIERYNKRFH